MRRRVGGDAETGDHRRTPDASVAHGRGDSRSGEEESDAVAFSRPPYRTFGVAAGAPGGLRGGKGAAVKKAFFDIDTQIDFLFPAGALYAPGAERVIGPVARLNRFAAESGIPLVSSMCAHPENSEEFKVWPPHCVAGTFGQQKPAATLMEKRVVIPNAVADLSN